MIQALFDSKLLLYFLLVLGTIVTTLLSIFLVQNFTILNDIQQNTAISNSTQTTINQTSLFLQQTKHEDEARDKQSQMERIYLSNQTRTLLKEIRAIVNDSSDTIHKLIVRYNNTTQKILQEIKESQNQNDVIIHTLKFVSMSNNAMLRTLLEEIGLNSTQIIEDDFAVNKTPTTQEK